MSSSTANPLSTPDPHFLAALQALGGAQPPPPPETPDEYIVPAVRKLCDEFWVPMARKIYGPLLPKESEYTLCDEKVPVEAGEIAVRVTIPSNTPSADKTYPLLVYIHGGGAIAGNLDTDDYKLRYLAVKFGVVTVNVDYRLAPEHQYPIPHDDCYAAITWAAQNASGISADPLKGFIVWGQSAGALFAASATHRARDASASTSSISTIFSKYPITGQILQVPALCHPEHFPERLKSELKSFEENAENPGMQPDFIRRCYRMISGPPTSPLISPLLQPSLSNLPPAFIQVSGWDPLRDEGIVYARLLSEAGVQTKLETYAGVVHGFEETTPEIPLAKRWMQDVEDGIQWLISLEQQ